MGGKIHRIRPSVIHLMRGQVFLIDERKIFTYCCSSGTQAVLGGGMYTPDELTEYFQELRETVQFKKWFFGHYHDNRNVNAEEILLYEQLIRIA